MAVKNQKFTDISKEDNSKERYGFDKDRKIVKLEDKGDPKPRAKKFRILAVLLWVLAIFFEVIGILRLVDVINWLPKLSEVTFLIIALILDFICVVIASYFWKKSNRIDPASEKNKTKFWLWNNLGVILSVVAFLPIIIFVLTNKDLDKKDKTIVTIIAVVLLAIAGLSSYDFNPISAEQLAKAEAEVNAVSTDGYVYWAPVAGKKYHVDKDCPALKNAKEITKGTVRQAFEKKLTDPCRRCIPELDDHDHEHE